MAGLEPLRRFIVEMTSLMSNESLPREDFTRLLTNLIKRDDWLPESMGECPRAGYLQNLLWCDPLQRFSVVSFVWAPGARTPIHDHQVWGLVGMMRGSESSQAYRHDPATGALVEGGRAILVPGEVELLLPSQGDIHQVANMSNESASLSIHVYGGNIGSVQRYTFDAKTGERKLFVSGYSNELMPNLWDYSNEIRQAATAAADAIRAGA
jgi:predicted metal-dependent enzyme (double-stranded beta helix superfamily)